MKAQIYNLKAEKIGDVTLPKGIFDVKAPDSLIAQSIRVILANKRSSYAKTKTRSEVTATRKKVWAQKGTGNARHGNRTAPIFVGGGVALGPDGNQNYSLKISQAMKRKALLAVLTKFAKDKRILVIDDFDKIKPKTKVAVKLITGLKSKDEVLSKSRRIGIITQISATPVRQSFGNLKDISLLSSQSLNIYDLSKQNYLIFSKKAISQFK